MHICIYTDPASPMGDKWFRVKVLVKLEKNVSTLKGGYPPLCPLPVGLGGGFSRMCFFLFSRPQGGPEIQQNNHQFLTPFPLTLFRKLRQKHLNTPSTSMTKTERPPAPFFFRCSLDSDEQKP